MKELSKIVTFKELQAAIDSAIESYRHGIGVDWLLPEMSRLERERQKMIKRDRNEHK